MGRIKQKFVEIKENKNGVALVVYITAGHPNMDITEKLIPALANAGADIIEIGMPFSDPTADGAIIQRSSQKALSSGTTLAKTLSMIGRIRNITDVPIVLFGYYNPIFAFGVQRFAKLASQNGVDGILVVDLPYEEADELRKETDAVGIDFISLIAPTTNSKRREKILRNATGFVYYITLTGITGTNKPVIDDVQKNILEIRKFSKLPIVAGFGITTTRQVRDIANNADGIVVGSAIVNMIDALDGKAELVEKVCGFVTKMKKATYR
ncbi:MAG: tryptophan synthase subunit alpha [Deltaproteobacteria bacterium]